MTHLVNPLILEAELMYDVFISYASDDRSWAEALEEKLTSSGITPYRDQSRLIPGEPYQDALFAALEDSKALILIWSQHTLAAAGQ